MNDEMWAVTGGGEGSKSRNENDNIIVIQQCQTAYVNNVSKSKRLDLKANAFNSFYEWIEPMQNNNEQKRDTLTYITINIENKEVYGPLKHDKWDMRLLFSQQFRFV